METYGRWPIVGAIGLAPISAAAAKRPALRPLAALLWHQTEEWVWPGSFLPWMNRSVIGSDRDDFPIDRRMGFIVNVVLGWGASALAINPSIAPVPVTTLYVSHLGNAALHGSWAIRHRKYDPGVVTAVLTLVPAGVIGLRQLAADPRISPRAQHVGVALGWTVSIGLLPMMKLRLRRARSNT